MLPNPIKKFVELFSGLPGIGPRQATRLAINIINGGKAKTYELSKSIAELENIKTCSQCFFIYDGENNLCPVCSNPQRQKNIIAIVEKETDLISIEKTNKFAGHYFIIGELKKDGVLDAMQKLRLNSLKGFIQKELDGGAEEIILAISPTTYGDFNSSLIAGELKNHAKKITRLGRGIPTGGEIEFADEDTLSDALKNRS